MENQPKQLKDTTIGLMIAVALFYDALSWLLTFILMGWIVIPLFYLTFMFWFKLHGISFLSMKRAPTHIIGFALEAFTLGIAPAMTAVVARVALTNKIQSSTAGKVVSMEDHKKKEREQKETVEKDKAA